MKECVIEAYLCKRVKELGGVCVKQDASLYGGIPDRVVAVCGYMAFVELKRPKGGRLGVRQKMWKKMIANAGTPWHLLSTHAEVDDFIEMVRATHERQRKTG